MATPAQTQVTLDASQFIASVDAIGVAITTMNSNLAGASKAFAGFAASTQNIETSLNQIAKGMQDVKTNTAETTNAVKSLTAVQQQQISIMNQVAISTRAAAQSLDQLANASNKTGQAGVKGAQQFTFAWDGIARLLAVTVIRRLFLDIAGAIQQSVSASAEYTEAVGRIVAINQNLGVSVGQLSQQFTNLSLSYGRSLKEVADAGRIAATAGGAQTAQQIEQITDAAVRLAEVTGSTAPQTATAISAVTQAFHLGAAEAQNVSNQLIHLTQSGIGIEAINGSIGRVSAQAQRLGISFSEMGLLMETLKETGISDTEMMTQLSAVMNSLERPTQRMRQLMEGNGIFSSQQLIQAQRLHGALQLIKQDISEENIQANQAVQGRRAGGGLAVADTFAQRSQNNPLANVNALNEGANAALRIVDATGKWNDELEKIKTIFQSEVAPAIIKSILDIFEPMGGLAKVVTDTGQTIAILVDPVVRVISWFSVWTNWLERVAELLGVVNAQNRLNAEAMRAFADATREGATQLNNWLSVQRQLSQNTLQQGTQSIANLFTPINAALTRQAEIQRERVHNLGEQIEASSKQIFGAFASQIEVLESVARQAESRIMESLKRVSEFGDKTDKDTFQHQLKSAGEVSQSSPFTNASQQNNAARLLNAQDNAAINQLNLIRDRTRRLNEEIGQLQVRGDANSIEAARRRFTQLRELNDQEADIRQGSSRRRAEFDARATGSDQTFNPFNREREAGARRLNAAEEAFEAANRRRLAAQQQALEVINRQLRDRLRLVQDGQRDIARLPNALLTPEGRPREGFQGAGGAERAVGQINTTINDQINRIRQLPASIEAGIAEALRTGSITTDQADQARRRAPSAAEIEALTIQLENQRLATTALFQTGEARRASETNQQRQISILQAIARNTEAANQDIANNTQQQRQFIQRGIEQVNRVGADLPSEVSTRARSLAARGTPSNAEGIRQADIAQVVARRLREELVPTAQRALTTAQRTNDPTDIRRAVDALEAVASAQRRLNDARPGNDPNNRIGLLQDTIRQLSERLARLPILEAAADLNRREGQQANDAIRNAGQAAGIEGPGANVAIQQSIAAFENLATSLNPSGQFPTALSTLAAATATAARDIAAATANLQVPRGQAPGAEGFASGGLIGNTFSSFGPDNTMIRARRGEFVVNPEDTRKWYSTLVAINRGDNPRGGGYAHGGSVTNSIGNMNFHVSGSDNPQETAKAVMKIIRREQRRGNA